MMTTNKTVYKFKKGQITVLDNIYAIQSLGSGDWWEKTGNDVDPSDKMGADLGDEIIITRDIEITIIVTTPGA
jgi:hypothetical protein